jgi:hypothetical protein
MGLLPFGSGCIGGIYFIVYAVATNDAMPSNEVNRVATPKEAEDDSDGRNTIVDRRGIAEKMS